jgi:gluconokinase
LPALLCTLAIGVMALVELIQQTPLNLGYGAEVE